MLYISKGGEIPLAYIKNINNIMAKKLFSKQGKKSMANAHRLIKPKPVSWKKK